MTEYAHIVCENYHNFVIIKLVKMRKKKEFDNCEQRKKIPITEG